MTFPLEVNFIEVAEVTLVGQLDPPSSSLDGESQGS
jgi:hypothetical protein